MLVGPFSMIAWVNVVFPLYCEDVATSLRSKETSAPFSLAVLRVLLLSGNIVGNFSEIMSRKLSVSCGMMTVAKAEQLANALLPNVVIFEKSLNVIVVRAEQVENAYAPMLVSVFGKVTLVSAQLRNAYVPMLVSALGKETELSFVHPSNK